MVVSFDFVRRAEETSREQRAQLMKTYEEETHEERLVRGKRAVDPDTGSNQ